MGISRNLYTFSLNVTDDVPSSDYLLDLHDSYKRCLFFFLLFVRSSRTSSFVPLVSLKWTLAEWDLLLLPLVPRRSLVGEPAWKCPSWKTIMFFFLNKTNLSIIQLQKAKSSSSSYRLTCFQVATVQRGWWSALGTSRSAQHLRLKMVDHVHQVAPELQHISGK